MPKKRAAERTSYAVRQKWDKEHCKGYYVRLRLAEDAELIDYIEAHKTEAGTTGIFRAALAEYIKTHR